MVRWTDMVDCSMLAEPENIAQDIALAAARIAVAVCRTRRGKAELHTLRLTSRIVVATVQVEAPIRGATGHGRSALRSTG